MAVASYEQWAKESGQGMTGQAGYQRYLANMANIGQTSLSPQRTQATSVGSSRSGTQASYGQDPRDIAPEKRTTYTPQQSFSTPAPQTRSTPLASPTGSLTSLTQQAQSSGGQDYGSWARSQGLDPGKRQGADQYSSYVGGLLGGSSVSFDSLPQTAMNTTRSYYGGGVSSPQQQGGQTARIRWKPVSEMNGRLVVLADQGGAYEIVNSQGQVVERGSSYGPSNGYGNTVRFSKPGGAYQGMSIRIGGKTYAIPNAGANYNSLTTIGGARVPGAPPAPQGGGTVDAINSGGVVWDNVMGASSSCPRKL